MERLQADFQHWFEQYMTSLIIFINKKGQDLAALPFLLTSPEGGKLALHLIQSVQHSTN